ncbi:MAG: NAD-dependent epimerase/dehydratase family protein [Candidatus Pelagibacter sp. TMED118]|nr:MAG: NAD-dependent epimerase/dehydratase family protein [Candidatus Pelagibacter sp. TMED118]
MEKIVITGANGQDGLILSEILVKKKFKVYGIIKKKKYKNKIKKVKYLNLNLLNYKEVEKKLIQIKPDCIVHFASQNPSYKELKNKKNFFSENMSVLKNIINYIKKNDNKIRLIFPGSSQMYGEQHRRVNEQTKFKPKNNYSVFRVKSHKMLMSFKKKYKLKFSTVILFNHDSKFRNKKFLIPRIVKAIKKKNKFFLQKITGENIYADFSHAYDICYGIYLLIKSKKNYNKIILSSNRLTSVNEIILFLIKLINSKLNIVDNKLARKNKKIIGDNKKARVLLNWKQKKNIFLASKEFLKKNYNV